MSNLTNEWYPPTQVIGMDNRRQYEYNTLTSTKGVIGNLKSYDIHTVEVKPNDVLLLRISDDLDLHTCREIQKEMNETFPNNTTLLCNDHIFKGLTILRCDSIEQIDETVDIRTGIDVDALFDRVMKGHPNDFLY
jgi:hypothetical protein